MTENVVRLLDYDKRSRQPDACGPRNPVDADVIVLPLIRSLNAPDDPNVYMMQL